MDHIVHIVDDNPVVLATLAEVLGDGGLDVRAYQTVGLLLQSIGPGSSGCVLLDLHMIEMDGLAALAALRARGMALPVIFASGNGDVTSSVRAMKAGAADFLEKPLAEEVLITAVRAACAQEAERRIGAIGRRYDADRPPEPTRREREIAALLLAGVAG